MDRDLIRIMLSLVATISFMFSEILFIYWIGGMNTLHVSFALFLIFLACTITIIKKFRPVEEF